MMTNSTHATEIDLDRLDARLAATGLSDFKASKLAGGPDLIRDLRRGKSRTLSATKISRLAEALECDPGYLTRAQDEIRRELAPEAGRMPAAMSISNDEIAILGLYRAASDAERKQIKAVMRAILATSETETPDIDARGRLLAS